MTLAQERKKMAVFFASGQELSFERNATIIGYGEKVNDAYFVVDGCVKSYSYTARGNERIHYLYAPGDIFPITQLFGPTLHEIGFTAFIASTVRRKTKDELIDFLRTEPSVSLTALQQQAIMQGRIINLNLPTAEQRLADGLITFSMRFGVREGDHYVTTLPITTQQLADMVRLTRETTGKVIAKFEHEGYLIFGRRQILVYPDKLKHVLTQ